ncbi:MAG: hypothetical protein Q8Q14_03270 [Gemmatimonadales bacterium]|nr:hypothetical protein [Gemmatimonadales bacterium]
MGHAAPLLAVLSISCAHGLSAQGQGQSERDNAQLRNDCRLAAQVLTLGQPADRYEWARDIIVKCDESGGQALASLWRSVPADSGELARVVYSTSRLRDQRILDELVTVARDGARPVVVRLCAFQVLVSYYQPGAYVPLRWLQQPPFGSPLGSVTEFRATEGSAPLGPSTRESIHTLMRQLTDSDPDATMRNAARFLAEAFEAETRAGG